MDNHFSTLGIVLASMETCHWMQAETCCAAYKVHVSVSPAEEFHLEFHCATGLLAACWLLQRAFTGMDPTGIIP